MRETKVVGGKTLQRRAPGDTAQWFLRGVRNSARKIDALTMRAEFLRSVVFPGAIQYKTDLVQESAPDDRTSKLLADIDALNRKIVDAEHKARCDLEITREVLKGIEDVRQRKVLKLYYMTTYPTYEEAGKTHKPIRHFANLRWHDVAREMKIKHLRDVHRIHREALITFEEVSFLPEEWYWEVVEEEKKEETAEEG